MTVCIVCLNPDVKALLLEHVDDPNLRALPPCSDGAPIGLAAEGRDRGKKRRASNYNRFIAECIRRREKGVPVQEQMRTCSIEWKQKKALSPPGKM